MGRPAFAFPHVQRLRRAKNECSGGLTEFRREYYLFSASLRSVGAVGANFQEFELTFPVTNFGSQTQLPGRLAARCIYTAASRAC
jgi:hypothetical protein